MEWPLIWMDLNIHYLKILYAKFFGPDGKENFLKLSIF